MHYSTSDIERIIQLKSELQSLQPLKEADEKRLNKKFRLEFNYNSNHLEGNTLTYGQTQLVLIYDKSTGDVLVSDIEEMKAHDVALTQIKELASEKERPLTEQFIKELNKTILVESFWKEAVTNNNEPSRKKIEIGQYKTTPNSVQLKNGEIHEYASPEETPSKMHDLMQWYNENQDTLQPVQLAAEFHYRFVSIHPFDDGNGRVARLAMNYILYRNDYPPVIIKSEDKEQYLTALQRADSGDLMAIIEYIEKQMLWSLNLSIKAARGEDIDELEDIEKEIALLRRDKLTTGNIYKTPKVSYELIRHINDDVWKPTEKILSKFNDFFAETTAEQYVNSEKIGQTTIFASPLSAVSRFNDITGTPKKYEIFGHDLNETDIDNISWSKKFLSLKSADSKKDFRIELHLRLLDDKYTLKIIDWDSVHKKNEELFYQERPYKNYFMKDDVDHIIRLISSYFIKIIKDE